MLQEPRGDRSSPERSPGWSGKQDVHPNQLSLCTEQDSLSPRGKMMKSEHVKSQVSCQGSGSSTLFKNLNPVLFFILK